MICELCGNDVPKLTPTKVEESLLQVCSNCERYGEPQKTKPERTGVTNGRGEVSSISRETSGEDLEKTLMRRQKRLKGRDIYADMDSVLVSDYSIRIRKARERQGLNQKKLARKINEKRSVIAKLETGGMRPDNRLIKKLERTLEIELLEEVPLETSVSDGSSGPLTIGDLILMAKKKKK